MNYPTIFKKVLQASVIVVAIFQFGCDAKYLTVEKHAKLIAPALKVKESDVKFLSYCESRAMKEIPNNNIVAMPGIVALTDTHFYILSRNEERVKSQGIVRIPISEMESLSTASSQFHLKHKGLILLIWLNEAPSKKLTEQKYETVSQLFAQNGVSIFEADQEYQIAKFSTRRRNLNFNSGFYSGGYGGSFSDGFESSTYGSPYPVGGNYDR